MEAANSAFMLLRANSLQLMEVWTEENVQPLDLQLDTEAPDLDATFPKTSFQIEGFHSLIQLCAKDD